MLNLAVATAVVALTAMLAAACLRLPARTGLLLAAYVLAAAEIILLTEVLSLFHQVSARGYLVGETALLVLAAAAWNWRGRPRVSLPTLPVRALATHSVLAFLLLAVGIAFGYQLFLLLSTPPNSWDSFTYHLARAAEWYQRRAVEYYPTHSESVNGTQPNAAMLMLYTFALLGRDTVAAVPQLVAELASLVAVYGIAVRIGFSRAPAAYAALLTATLSVVALQSTSTQYDLVTAAFVAATVYFVLGRTTPELALAGLALGVAVGTKATAAYAIPLVLVAALMVHERRRVLHFVGFACVGVALVGSFGYVLNVVHIGRPLGHPDTYGPIRGPDLTLAGTASTSVRYGYNFVDLSGYPIHGRATRPFEVVAEHVFRVGQISVNPPGQTVLEPPAPAPFVFEVNREADEIRSYFGPLGALLLVLAAWSLIAIVRGRAPPVLLVPALAIPLFILGMALSTKYSEYNGRYMMPAVVVAMPLTAWLYQRRHLAAAVAVVAALTVALTHAHSNNKPTGAEKAQPIWWMTRAEAQAVTWPDMARVIEAVEREVPADGRLGYVLRYNDWVYPLYGPELSRRLVKLPRSGVFAAAERENLDAVVVAGPLPEPRSSWRLVDSVDRSWALFVRDSS